MQTDRETVMQVLRTRGEHDAALRAACVLPRSVDTDEDAGLIHQLGLNVATLEFAVLGEE